jgi:hypothetical protein
MKQTKPETNPVKAAFGVAQETALMTLNAAVKAEQVAEDYAQGLYKIGYDANVAGLQVIKAYWDSLSQIRQEWVKQGAELAEKAVKLNPADIKLPALPLQKEALNFGQELMARTQKAYEAFTAPVKTAK